MPAYHWCPGEMWRPEWGFNWDGGNCHDDHHRDMDGFSHDHDWWGQQHVAQIAAGRCP